MKPLTIALAAIACLAFAAPRTLCQDDTPRQEKNPVVVFDTTMGRIEIELFADKAPITVKNFLSYVDKKHFDGTIFHRIVKAPIAVIQGGGFDKDLNRKDTDPPIKNEADNGLSNVRGTLSMARTPDPDSATSQFFINVKDNTQLDRSERSAGYCVFGKVIEGMDVVDKILVVKTVRRGQHETVPETPIVINSAKRKEEPKPEK